MVRKALTILYGLEAAFLVLPWQAFFYGRLDLSHNEGIVLWLGVPVFYTAARLVQGYGPLLRIRVGVFLASNFWIISAFILNLDPHGFGPRNQLVWILTWWIPALNFGLILPVAKWLESRLGARMNS